MPAARGRIILAGDRFAIATTSQSNRAGSPVVAIDTATGATPMKQLAAARFIGTTESPR
jgi:hypothetical protein